MNKGIVYYTDNSLEEPIFSLVQKYIAQSGLPITSVSLQPLYFGNNITLNEAPGYITMVKQILAGLEKSKATYVFFCEHDVLYPTSHFEFTPMKNNIFYYNSNVWRWKYPDNLAIRYDRLISLSGLCVNRKFALEHYKTRLSAISKLQLTSNGRREPGWARKWGYEPGTKKTKRGGFSDDDFETWSSKTPLVDIRHKKTFSQPKVSLDNFIHKPTNWQEITIDEILGWNLRELFQLSHINHEI